VLRETSAENAPEVLLASRDRAAVRCLDLLPLHNLSHPSLSGLDQNGCVILPASAA
jgi:hypothetical protein